MLDCVHLGLIMALACLYSHLVMVLCHFAFTPTLCQGLRSHTELLNTYVASMQIIPLSLRLNSILSTFQWWDCTLIVHMHHT